MSFFWLGVADFVVTNWVVIAAVVVQQNQAAKARQAQAAARDAAAREADAAKGTQLVIEGEISTLPVIYGRALIGGSRVYHGTFSNYTFAGPATGATVFTTARYASEAPVVLPNRRAYVMALPGSNVILDSVTTTDVGLPVFKNVTSSLVGYGDDMNLVYSTAYENFLATPPTKVEGQVLFQVDGVVSGLVTTWATPIASPYDGGSWSDDQVSQSATGGNHEFLITQQALAVGELSACYEVDIDNGRISGDYVNNLGEAVYPGDDGDMTVINAGLAAKTITLNTPLSKSARIHFYPSGGVADPLMSANDATRVNAKFTNCAFATAVYKLNRDTPQYNGVPQAQFYVEGTKVSTITGAAGSRSLGSRVYSNNSALCLLDYLLNTVYGRGLPVSEIDLDSFALAASICDIDVTPLLTLPMKRSGALWNAKGGTRTIKLYECNLALDTAKPLRDNIEAILGTMNEANLVWSGGKYKLILPIAAVYKSATTYNAGDIVQYGADATVCLYRALTTTTATPVVGPSWEEAIVARITDDNIIRDSQTTFSWPNAQARLNFATVRFLNESLDFKEDTVSWPEKNPTSGLDVVHATFLAEDSGLLLETEAFASGITTMQQAKARAEYLVRVSRVSTTYNFNVDRSFVHLEPGDTVHIASATLGIPGDLLRITEIKSDKNGSLNISAVRFDANAIAWNVSDTEVTPTRKVRDYKLAQATDLNVVFSEIPEDTSVGTLEWTAADDVRVKSYRILIASLATPSSLTDWATLGTIDSSNSLRYKLPALLLGDYMLAVVSVGNGGVSPRDTWPVINLQLTTLEAVNPASLVFYQNDPDQDLSGGRLLWTNPISAKVNGFNLYVIEGTIATLATDPTFRFGGYVARTRNSSTTSIALPACVPGDYVVAVASVSNNGAVSPTVTWAKKDVTVLTAIDVTGVQDLSLVATGRAFKFADSVTEVPLDPLETFTVTAQLQNQTGYPTFTATAYDSSGAVIGTLDDIAMPYTGAMPGDALSHNQRTVTTTQFTQHAGTSYITIKAVLGTTYDLLSIYRANDGSGVLLGLSNENINIQAAADGTVVSYASAHTDVALYQGFEDKILDWTFTLGTLVNCTANINGVGTPVTGSATVVVNVASLTADEGSVILTASRTGYPSVAKRITLHKVKAGAAGSNAISVKIGTTDQLFVRATADVAAYTPATTTLSSGVFNGTASAYAWEYWSGSAWIAAPTTAPVRSNTISTYLVAENDFAAARTYRVVATVEGLSYYDELTLVHVTGGTDALTVIQSNEAHVISAAADGTTVTGDYTGSGNIIRVFEGAQELQYVAGAAPSLAAGQYSIVETPTNITARAGTAAGYTASFGVASGLSAGNTTASSSFAITIKKLSAAIVSITKVQSFTKTKAGAVGANGAAGAGITITANNYAFVHNAAGAVVNSPSYVQLAVALASNLSAVGQVSGQWSWTVVAGTFTGSLTPAANGSLSNFFVGAMTTQSVTFKCTYLVNNMSGTQYQGQTYYDTITIYKVFDGAGLTGILTNESHTLPASSTGIVSSVVGATGTFNLYKGSTAIASGAGVGQAVFSVVGTPAVTIAFAGNVYTVSAAGAWGATANSDPINITLRASYNDAVTGVINIDKVFSLSKGVAGVGGGAGSTGLRGIARVTTTTAYTTKAAFISASASTQCINALHATFTGGAPDWDAKLGDSVTFAYTGGTGWSATWVCTAGGSVGTWSETTLYIDGNAVINGTLSANVIAAGTIQTSSIATSGYGNFQGVDVSTLTIAGVSGATTAVQGGNISTSTPNIGLTGWGKAGATGTVVSAGVAGFGSVTGSPVSQNAVGGYFSGTKGVWGVVPSGAYDNVNISFAGLFDNNDNTAGKVSVGMRATVLAAASGKVSYGVYIIANGYSIPFKIDQNNSGVSAVTPTNATTPAGYIRTEVNGVASFIPYFQ